MKTLLTALVACSTAGVAVAQTTSAVLRFGGVEREYLIHVPSGWDGATQLPMLIGLHGGGGSHVTFAGPNRFLETAEREGFVAVFPNAVNGVWNDGRRIYPPEVLAVDDVGFVAALIDQVAANHAIASDRIYVTGMSNGGMLTHRLALEMGYIPGGNRLAGFAPIVANLPLDLLPAEPGLPLHGLLTVGTLDPLMPFEGGQVNQTKGYVLSSANTRDVWRHRLGLSAATFDEVTFADVSPDDGFVTAEFYESNYGPSFAHYVVHGGGHATPGSTSETIDQLGYGPTNRDIVTADEIWRFFADRPAIPDMYLAGDYNRDGLVNVVDYTVWRDEVGGPPLDNDYRVWAANYSSGLLPVSVPEPSPTLLIGLGGLVVSLRSRCSPKVG